MRRHLVKRHSNSDSAELNITAFMSLMVILVPFLLITAVFSRTAVLELNLPQAEAGAKASSKQRFNLTITVRPSALEIRNGSALIKRVGVKSNDYDYRTLSKIMRMIKVRYADKKAVTILAQSNTSYDTLVQIMDSVRSIEIVQAGSVYENELFPDISIGDAPHLR